MADEVSSSRADELLVLDEEQKARLTQCKAELAELGIVLRGSVNERLVQCGKKNCRCQGDPPALHGPYYEWTRKVRGKTKTARLTPAEAETYQQWIANGRRLNEILANWESIGIEAADEIRGKRRR